MNFYCFLLVININFKFVKLMEFSPEFWTSLADYNGGGYNFDYAQQKNAAFNSAYNQQQTQYQKNFVEHKKPAYIIPNNDKEQLYIYLDKGQPHYMPLNEHELPKISHSTFNINGRNLPLNWQPNKNNFKNYNNQNKHQKKYRKYYKNHNFDKKIDCHEKSDRKNYRPNWWGKAYDFEFKNDVRIQRPCGNFKRQRNYKKKYNKCENDYNFNECGKHKRKPKFPSNHQNTNKDCNSDDERKKAMAKSKVTIQQNNIQVETENEVFVGSSQAGNNSQTEKTLLQTENPNEEMLGMTLATPDNQQTPTTTTTEKSFITMHRGVVNVGPLTDAEIKALDNFKVIIIHEKDPRIQTQTTESSLRNPNSLTDSPIYYIQLLDKNHNFKRKKPKNSQPIHMPEFQQRLLGNIATANPLGNEQQLPKLAATNATSDALLINSLSENPNELDNLITTTEITTMISTNENENNFNSNKGTSEPNIEQTQMEPEPKKTIGDSADLQPSENRIFEYVTKLDKPAPKNEINYMEPIAFETYSMEPKFHEKNKTKNKRFQLKQKRNSNTQGIKPRKKKSTTMFTTPKTANTTTSNNTTLQNAPKLIIDTLKAPETVFESNTENDGSQREITEFIESSSEKFIEKVARGPKNMEIKNSKLEQQNSSKKFRNKKFKEQQNWKNQADEDETENDEANELEHPLKNFSSRKKLRNSSSKSRKRTDKLQKMSKRFGDKKIRDLQNSSKKSLRKQAPKSKTSKMGSNRPKLKTIIKVSKNLNNNDFDSSPFVSKKFQSKQLQIPRNSLQKSHSRKLKDLRNSSRKLRQKKLRKSKNASKIFRGKQLKRPENSSKQIQSKRLKNLKKSRSKKSGRSKNPAQKFVGKPQDLEVVGSNRRFLATSQEDPCEEEKLNKDNYKNDEGFSETEDQYIDPDNTLDDSTSENEDNEINDNEEVNNEVYDNEEPDNEINNNEEPDNEVDDNEEPDNDVYDNEEEEEPSEYENEQSNEFRYHGQEIQTAEMNILGADCDNSNEVSYDGDQYLQNINVLTPSPNYLC